MLDSSLKSSQVICQALGLEPGGVPAKKDGVCALCGAPVKTGQMQAPLSLGPGFVDDLYLAARGSHIICGWCTNVMGLEGLRATGYGVFSAEGVRPFRKWGDIAKSLLDPPVVPFAMVYATANNQHMAWRAPVNDSQDLFYVRVGLRDLKIRRRVLFQSIEDCVLLGTALESGKMPNVVRKTLPHPFLCLSPDLKDVGHGIFNAKVFPLAASTPGLAEPLARLRSLTLGESWALRFVLAVKPQD